MTHVRTCAAQPRQRSPQRRRILKLNYELRARIYSDGGGGGDLEGAVSNFTTHSYFFSGELAAKRGRGRGRTGAPPRRGKRLRNDSLTRRPLNSPLVFSYPRASPRILPLPGRDTTRPPDREKVCRNSELLLSAGIVSLLVTMDSFAQERMNSSLTYV